MGCCSEGGWLGARNVACTARTRRHEAQAPRVQKRAYPGSSVRSRDRCANDTRVPRAALSSQHSLSNSGFQLRFFAEGVWDGFDVDVCIAPFGRGRGPIRLATSAWHRNGGGVGVPREKIGPRVRRLRARGLSRAPQIEGQTTHAHIGLGMHAYCLCVTARTTVRRCARGKRDGATDRQALPRDKSQTA